MVFLSECTLVTLVVCPDQNAVACIVFHSASWKQPKSDGIMRPRRIFRDLDV